MNIIHAAPPNFADICMVFPRAADAGVLFCYGDSIYNPGGGYIPRELIVHEEVHCEQQSAIGPDLWWRRYLIDPSFRYGQELAAHIVEYREFISHTKNRVMRRSYLNAVASRLSGPLYGNAVSYDDAIAAILDT